MLSFRNTLTRYRRAERLLCTAQTAVDKNCDESKTQQPVSDRKQLRRHRKWGVWVLLLGHNPFHLLVARNKSRLTQEESLGHLQSSAFIGSVSGCFLPQQSRLHFKHVWHQHPVHPFFPLCVAAENSFDEIGRRNSWPTNTMTPTVPKGRQRGRPCDGSLTREHRTTFAEKCFVADDQTASYAIHPSSGFQVLRSNTNTTAG